jgi:hypothetical protein
MKIWVVVAVATLLSFATARTLPDAGLDLTVEMSDDEWKRPDFCGKSDCPRFKTDEHTDNYDVRTYEKSKWATTVVNDTKYELAYTKGTTRLMKYFKGGNEKDESIDLTTPTLVFVPLKEEKDNGETERCYQFSYWLGEDHQEEPPQPTDAEVKIEEFDEITVYVRVFSGFASEGSIVKEAKALRDLLKDDDQDFDEHMASLAVYDPPTRLLNRHNEIFLKKGSSKQAVV